MQFQRTIFKDPHNYFFRRHLYFERDQLMVWLTGSCHSFGVKPFKLSVLTSSFLVDQDNQADPHLKGNRQHLKGVSLMC
jgi:hypothetical protein